MQQPQMSLEELYPHAQENAITMMLAGIAFAKEQGKSPVDFALYAGGKLVPGWSMLKGKGAMDLVQGIMLNITSTGGKVYSLSGDEAHAQAMLDDGVTAEWEHVFNLTRDDIDSMWNLFAPVADALGMRYEWHRTGEHVTIEVSQ